MEILQVQCLDLEKLLDPLPFVKKALRFPSTCNDCNATENSNIAIAVVRVFCWCIRQDFCW